MKASRERMESVSGVRCAIAQGGSCGVRTHGKTRFRTREKPMVQCRCMAAGRRCGACHITARHNINMALRCLGCTWGYL